MSLKRQGLILAGFLIIALVIVPSGVEYPPAYVGYTAPWIEMTANAGLSP
jgi:hypothetical protein